MRIVFINYPLETFTPTQSGAISTWIWECCRAAARKGAEPLLITRQCEAQPYDWPATVFIDYPRVPSHGLLWKLHRIRRRASGWRHLGQEIYARRILDAIRSRGLETTPLMLMNDPETAVFLRQKLPCSNIIHWFHNPMESPPRIRRLFAGSTDIVVAVSDFVARWTERYYNLPQGAVQTVRNGVDLEKFCPAKQVPQGLPIISFLGRTGIEKAPDLLLRAAMLLAKQTREFKLQIIGSNHWDRFEVDNYQRELSMLVAQLENVGIEVRRLGHVTRSQLPEELQKAHIHVVPSRWDEPCALTLFEGMASGLAVVASRTGGTPEVVGDSGLLFERDDAEELAAHLGSLVKSETLRNSYGRKARERAMQFPWNNVWTKITKLSRTGHHIESLCPSRSAAIVG